MLSTQPVGPVSDDVPESVKRARLLELQALQNDVQLERHRGMVGQVHRVLVEGGSRRRPEQRFGRNLQFDRIVFLGGSELDDAFVDVEITSATALTLTGRLLPAGARSEPRAAALA